MRTRTIPAPILVAIALLLGSISGFTYDQPAAAAAGLSESNPRLTHDDAELVAWAHGRYRAAGLALPEISVSFDSSGVNCDGAEGLYSGDGVTNEVVVCIANGDTAGLDLLQRRTLLHEFAHAWDRANLDPTARGRIMAELGTEVWAGEGKPTLWKNRGAERFAEALVHGLLDQPRRPVMAPMGCHELVALFESITAIPALGPGLPWCIPDSVQ